MSFEPKPPLRPFAPDKIYGHMDRVKEWLETGKSRPVTYELDLTNLCGHACPHCFGRHPARDDSHLPRELALSIIRQIREHGGRGLTFTGGGDPLLSPYAVEAVRHARSQGLDVGFITNAQSLDEKTARALLADCEWLRVSLDAATPEVFREIHGMGERQFRKVLDNVRLLCRLKKETGSSCTVGIGFLTSAKTARDIYGFAVLGRELGVDYAQYRPLLRRLGEPAVDYGDETVLAEMRRAAALSTESYTVVSSEHKYALIQKGDLKRNYDKCYGQEFAAVVAADGRMYVCCHMRGMAKYALGDLSKETLAEIWNGEKRRRAAAGVDFKDCPPLCRCGSFSWILWNMKENGASAAPSREPKDHPNFL